MKFGLFGSAQAQLGFRSFNEMVGRVDRLDMRRSVEHLKAKGVDLSRVLYQTPPKPGARSGRSDRRSSSAADSPSLRRHAIAPFQQGRRWSAPSSWLLRVAANGASPGQRVRLLIGHAGGGR